MRLNALHLTKAYRRAETAREKAIEAADALLREVQRSGGLPGNVTSQYADASDALKKAEAELSALRTSDIEGRPMLTKEQMGMLTDTQVEMLELFLDRGMSGKMISQELGVHESNVYQHLRRAAKDLGMDRQLLSSCRLGPRE